MKRISLALAGVLACLLLASVGTAASMPTEGIEALETCEADLDRIDASWFEVLDFRAFPSRPTQGAEFG